MLDIDDGILGIFMSNNVRQKGDCHKVVWDANDNAHGINLEKMFTDNFNHNIKLILIK